MRVVAEKVESFLNIDESKPQQMVPFGNHDEQKIIPPM
jgi:hypothetical protein